MIEKKLEVLVETYVGPAESFIRVWVDDAKDHLDYLKSMPEVLSASKDPFNQVCLTVLVDPRYNMVELADEIRHYLIDKLETEKIPDVFYE